MIDRGSSLRGLSSVSDDRVGELLGDRAHQRALAGVAVAAAAEHAEQAAARVRARRIEHLGERVGVCA